jgi:integrase
VPVLHLRATWADGANYATKNLEATPTLPFTDAAMRRILEACDRYPGNRARMRAFVLVMRHSGLRIGDTIALDESRLSDNTLLPGVGKVGTVRWPPRGRRAHRTGPLRLARPTTLARTSRAQGPSRPQRSQVGAGGRIGGVHLRGRPERGTTGRARCGIAFQ